jgi:A/G-specific adenine glycosylase
LHDTARILRDEFDGRVPSDVAQLRQLPGVGEYTANAIASFAFDERVAVVDTNVGRVLARALANESLTPARARSLARSLLPRSQVRAFNQAMLDLGSQFCTSSPRCADCPLRRVCRWRIDGGDDPAPKSAGVSRPQGRFEGSDRQIRGRILALLRDRPHRTGSLASGLDDVALDRIERLTDGLIADGLVRRTETMLELA